MAKSDAAADAADGSITLEGLAAIVAGLAEAVETLVRQPIPALPRQLPRARTTAELLSKMKVGEARQGQTRADVYGQTPAFRPDDIVRLLHEDKLAQLRQMGKVVDGELYGVVKAFMYRRRKDGLRKYKVDFGKGIGEDGLMETEIELVRAA